MSERKTPIAAALSEIGHLFVEDGSLALFAAIWILLVAGAVKILDFDPLWGSVVLAIGIAAVLAESLSRQLRSKRR
jgi:hypothetical protein